jgi:hypothetical protein
MKYILFFTLITLIQGCSSSSTSKPLPFTPDFCPKNGEYFTIQHHDKQILTICPIDSPSSCHNDFYLQAYEDQEIDINDDGRKDLIIIIKAGLVGIDHDINYYAAYFACPNHLYRRVLFDAYTKIESTKDSSRGSRILSATRSCYNSASGKFSTNKYFIEYNDKTGIYGPPNNNERLLDFCGEYELSITSRNQNK